MSYVAALEEHWPDGAPDWVEALAREVDVSSIKKVSVKLGRSTSLVSQVLRNLYTGDLEACEDAVSGVLMARTVDCPSLGDLPVNECRDWRKLSKNYQSINPLRSRMFRACNRCPVNGKPAPTREGKP